MSVSGRALKIKPTQLLPFLRAIAVILTVGTFESQGTLSGYQKELHYL